jgi:hypothetical protein
MAQQSSFWFGLAWLGKARYGVDRHGKARLGHQWCNLLFYGFWCGEVSARRGTARYGGAGSGPVGLGKGANGSRNAKPIYLWLGAVWLG